MTPTSVVIASISHALRAVIPVMAITVGVNNIPVAEATLEVVAERSDAALAAATAAGN